MGVVFSAVVPSVIMVIPNGEGGDQSLGFKYFQGVSHVEVPLPNPLWLSRSLVAKVFVGVDIVTDQEDEVRLLLDKALPNLFLFFFILVIYAGGHSYFGFRAGSVEGLENPPVQNLAPLAFDEQCVLCV